MKVSKVSIVIAVGIPGKYLDECVANCRKLNYPDFEIIVLPDSEWIPPSSEIKVVPTGKVRPAEKRDKGVEISDGEIVAIIDDDAYPEPDWLEKAVRHFEDTSVSAVGGPGITPTSDNLKKRISGWIYESPVVSGSFTYRYIPGKKRFVDDYPTSSLIIRKIDFIKAGGFDTGYWPGEDTILCLKLTHELGKKIVYDPEVIVHHHRRDIFIPHLRQIKSYAFHRGFFVKKFPETSLKISYFIPSAFALFLVSSYFFYAAGYFRLWIIPMVFYSAIIFTFSLKTFNPAGILGIFTGTFLTHFVYGVWFLKGLFSKEIKD